MNDESESGVYEFDGFIVDVTRRRLMRNGVAVQLTSKAFDTLSFLLANRGVTVTKTELMNSIWSDSAVEENNLTQQISALRRVLGERPNDHRFIVTVPGRGYCFVADVKIVDSTPILLRDDPQRRPRFDPAVVRGYSFAFAQILLLACAFLWSAFAGPDNGRPQSLAVINFKTASTGDEFIGVGISETLRARLGSVEDLIVRHAPEDQDILDAGRQLNVDSVVTGTVQQENGRVRVAVEVLDVNDGRIVWGKTFDEAASNTFALQDMIAGEVARALKIRLSSAVIREHLFSV
jgi:DNA-binding winged helix-turn-helix (wHTH) protein/TolB-like protein